MLMVLVVPAAGAFGVDGLANRVNCAERMGGWAMGRAGIHAVGRAMRLLSPGLRSAAATTFPGSPPHRGKPDRTRWRWAPEPAWGLRNALNHRRRYGETCRPWDCSVPGRGVGRRLRGALQPLPHPGAAA